MFIDCIPDVERLTPTAIRSSKIYRDPLHFGAGNRRRRDSPRDDGLIRAIDGPDNSLLVPAGTSFSAAIVSVAALVRAKFLELSAFKSSIG